MDQVRFELTTSRAASEVTLTFTTSNLFAQQTILLLSGMSGWSRLFSTDRPCANCWPVAIRAEQHQSGRKIEQSSGATAPRRVTDEATRLCAIPEFRFQWEQAVRVRWFELLLPHRA